MIGDEHDHHGDSLGHESSGEGSVFHGDAGETSSVPSPLDDVHEALSPAHPAADHDFVTGSEFDDWAGSDDALWTLDEPDPGPDLSSAADELFADQLAAWFGDTPPPPAASWDDGVLDRIADL